MRSNWFARGLIVACLAVLPLAVTGCGGLAAAGAVSPLQFLLPGLLQNEPQTNPKPADSPNQQAKPSVELAQAR